MRKIWHDTAWNDYVSFFIEDRRLVKKINELLKSIDRNKYDCIGKPEALSGNHAGFWSVRIDEKNRLIFRINNDCIEIVQCGSHYGDK